MNPLLDFLQESVRIKSALATDKNFLNSFERATSLLVTTVKSGGTIYSAGNGGSACDAMHLTEELVARYKRERPGIKAMHFLDPSAMSCWSNDYEYASHFKRQLETFCTHTDCFIAISTSGNSQNLINAVESAKTKNVPTIGLLGKDGGKLSTMVDHSLIVPSDQTDRIQEVHILLIHAFCEALES